MALNKVKEILSDQLGVEKEKINGNSLLIDDLGADSLDVVELLMLLEDEYEIELTEEQTVAMKTVNDVVKIIEEFSK